jgi:RHS repeat-associated protein
VFRLLTRIAFPDGSAQTMNYDANGNATSFTDRAGKQTSMTYDAGGHVLTMTNPAGGVTTFAYGSDGTVSSIGDAAGNTTTIGYDALRRANLVTHPDGSTRRYTLDADGHMLTDTDERGKTARFTYDANGNLTSIADPLGIVTAIGYDALDRAVSVTDPSGGKTSRTFDSIGRVASRTDRNGNTFTFSYDPASRLTSVTDPVGSIWRRTYDSEGFPLSNTDPLNNTWAYNRDPLGRLVKSTSPANAAVRIAYDQAGRVSGFTDPAGVATAFTSDPRGVLAGVSQGSGLVSNALARNDLGLATQLTDGNGQIWQHGYDSRGRTLSATDPLGAVTTMAYNSMSRVSQTVFPGQLGNVQFTYDGRGNIVRKLYSDGTDLNFMYDDASRLTSATGLTLAFDAVGEVSSSNGIAIARDTGGRIVSMTLAPGKTVSYAYDRRDLLTRVTDWAGGITAFTYDAASRLTSVTRPNGVTATFTYNADDAVTGIQEAGKVPVSSIAVQRDGRGQITSETRNVPVQATPDPGSLPFGYDGASQVSGYSYDALGRLAGDGSRSYTWDLASRLTSYADSAASVSLTYDAFGRRTSRTRVGVTQNYVWNYALRLQSISIVRQGGTDLRYYVHTPGGALLYSIEAAGNTRHFYHFDEAGNTIYLTDDNANVTDAYAYTPYGMPLKQTGNTDNPFTFAGQLGAMQELAAGLYYMRARYYDPASAHFISGDPALRSPVPNETNAYTFARMNPLLFGDPSGLSAQINFDGVHSDFSVDVWNGGKIIGTLSASFGEGGYRASGGYGGVLFGGQGTFVLQFRPGQCITQNAGPTTTFVAGGRVQDERAAQAILSAIDFGSINQPQYQAGTPAADYLLARLKDAGPTAEGGTRTLLGFKTAKGSGDWTSYGVIYPARTCNTFTGTMLNVYFGAEEPTGILGDSVTENLQWHLNMIPPPPTYRRFPGTENSENLVIWMDYPK